MKAIRILLLVLLFPALSFAQYKIVLKTGKVIEGKYLHEDQTTIYIESGGIKMNFKKDKLDLEKMKELNAKQEMPSPESAPPSAKPASPGSAQTKEKKPARVYTAEDLERMRQIWEEGATQTGPATQAEPSTEGEQPQTAAVPQTQSQPMAPPEPRDEKAIRDEIENTKLQIAETEKQIQDLRSKGRVVETWQKLLAKQQQRVKDLQAELKAVIAARKAAKTSRPRAVQTQSQPQQ